MQSDTITKEQITRFRHFSLRLSERYGILISFHEYMELHNNYFCVLWQEEKRGKNGKHVRFGGHMIIQNKLVLVAKGDWGGLITVLPLKSKFWKYQKI